MMRTLGCMTAVIMLCVTAWGASRMNLGNDAGTYTLDCEDEGWVTFDVPLLGEGLEPEVHVTETDDGWYRVAMKWHLDQPLQQDELSVRFDLQFEPDFWWAPHLTPEDGYVMAQHVFRTPALIASRGRQTFTVMPDLSLCGQSPGAPWFMDVDAPARALWLGMVRTEIPEHVLFRKTGGMVIEAGDVELAFYLAAYRDENEVPNAWKRVTEFQWARYARPLLAEGQPNTVPLDRYVEHTYRWAFDAWKDAVWQEFEIDGVRVGSPAFIVTTSQSPNYPGEPSLREPLSAWNQAWFSTLRAASGVMRYALRTNNDTLKEKARLTKEFSLAAPVDNGLFPTVYGTETTSVEKDGKRYRRSKGWETGHWLNSNRMPFEHGVSTAWYNVLDMSWTCLLMLRWHEELEADERLLTYARTYADRLLGLQDEDGFFPAWLHPETHEPADVLRQSPEASMSVTFLLKLGELTGRDPYRRAALRAMDAVLKEIVPSGRWEDFETYWSCSPWGKDEYLGAKVTRNGMYKQCNLSTFWTAEALLASYRATKDVRYLRWGRRTLDELAMTQQAWQPPFIYIPAVGGFGVMNCDGEWNDARQSLFAELFLQYYAETGEPHLFERGVAALKASFVMMYCPENPAQKALWEKVWPFFGPEDFGFMMENYGHGGAASPEGEGIGEFTIFTWGNGAASEARNRVYDHFGDVYIDRPRKRAFGIDSVSVRASGNGWTLTDLGATPRAVKVVFEDGSERIVQLDGEASL